MSRILRKIILSLYTFIIALSFLQVSTASSPVITITTKEYYPLGDNIIVNGTLTSDGSPITDGLVAIQIRNPKNETIVIRTLETGGTPSPQKIFGVDRWPVETLTVDPCDSNGNPQSSFLRGKMAYFNVTIRNNIGSEQFAIIELNLFYSDGTPSQPFPAYNATIAPGPPIWTIVGFNLPNNAPTGTTRVYASTLNKLPQNGGIAWCPEKSATFTIRSTSQSLTTASTSYQETDISPLATPGTFSMTFRTYAYGGILGNYTVHVTSKYGISFASNRKSFEVILIGDITGNGGVPDGKVDIKDVYRVIKAFNSKPGDPNWDPPCDINNDGKVDIKDVYTAIRNFGKRWVP